MTVYTWPDTRAFTPQMQELRVVDNTQRSAESSLSGYVQTTGMPGARWAWGLDMAPDTAADRQALEAYLLRLSGRQHRVRLWDHKHPRPRGTIALAGVTLGAAAAQFATTLTLASCRGANALLGGSFELDSNADGVGNGWLRFSAGSTGTVSAFLDAGNAVTGGLAQVLVAGALGAGGSNYHGIYQVCAVAHLAGQSVAAGVWAVGTAGTTVVLAVNFLDSLGGPLLPGLSTAVTASGGAQFLEAVGSVPAGAVTASFEIYHHSGTGAAAALYVDGAQFVRSPVGAYPPPATMLAGDWLGLANGQLVRVVADATANDAGAMTVEVRHMLRSAVASGSAVTLDKPTALYVRTEAGIAMPRQPGNAEPGLSVDFVEVFA